MAEEEHISFKFYHYDPSLIAAIIAAVVFGLSTALHFFQLIRAKTWFCLALAIGGIFQTVGYVGRGISHSETPNWTLGPYVMQTLLILVAPALFAASIYMELGRIILLVDGERHAIIKKRFLTKIFVTGDIVSFLTQGSGGGIMAQGTLENMETGEKIVIGGLLLQIVVFGFFIISSAIFHHRVRLVPTSRSHSTPWRKHIYALYVASALVLIRSIFRVIEYIQGNDGYLLRHEVFLYIFDTLLMVVVMVTFNVVHPGEIKAILRGEKAESHGLQAVYRRQHSSTSSILDVNDQSADARYRC